MRYLGGIKLTGNPSQETRWLLGPRGEGVSLLVEQPPWTLLTWTRAAAEAPVPTATNFLKSASIFFENSFTSPVIQEEYNKHPDIKGNYIIVSPNFSIEVIFIY